MGTDFAKAYNSFSGCDIRASFGTDVIGTLQGISWSVTREKAPIYTMGAPDPRAFARGKRGIAGSLIFVQFDKHALLGSLSNLSKKFSDDKDALAPRGEELLSDSSATSASTVFQQETGTAAFASPRADQVIMPAYYSDQIPPFDVTLTAANEYGHGARMMIYGVEILNEGAGVSIDDIVLEQQMTFIARGVMPWTNVTRKELK